MNKKQREELIEEAAKAICECANGVWEMDRPIYIEDAEVAFKVFQPALMFEVQAEYNRLSEEMDRLVDENEFLESRVEELEAGQS